MSDIYVDILPHTLKTRKIPTVPPIVMVEYICTGFCKYVHIDIYMQQHKLKEFAVDTGETFTLLMESMVDRFSDMDDDQIEIQRQRIMAQRRWADMELLAINTALKMRRHNEDP